MLYLLLTIAIMIIIVYKMPKHLSYLEYYTTSLFAVLFAVLTDLYLDAKYLYYWYFTQQIEWKWLIVLLGGKPPVNMIFLNFFPFTAKWIKKAIYIFLWSILLTLMEWGLVHWGKVLQYGNWNIWYSALLYPILLTILYGNRNLIKHLIDKPNKT